MYNYINLLLIKKHKFLGKILLYKFNKENSLVKLYWYK